MTPDEDKTKAELLQELETLRRRISELEQAEPRLKDSEKQFKELFENTPLGVYRTTPDGRIIMANPALIRMLGYSSFEELSQRDLEKQGFAPGYPRSAFKGLIEREGKVVGLESAWVRRDGTTIFIIENARAIRDESGKTLHYEGIVQDITERKKAEQELKKYQFIVESAYDAIFFKDTESRYIVVNNKVLEAFALPREKVIGKNDYQIMPNKDEASKNIEDDNTVFKTGKPTEITKRMTDAKGKQRWFHGIKVPQFDDNGKVVGLVGIARDITEHKKAEQALQESENKYRDLVEEMTDVIYTLDTEGNVKSVNKAGKATFGRDRGEVLGNSFTKWIPQEQLPEAMAAFKRVLGGEKITAETVLLDKDGKPHNVEFSSTPMMENGKVIGTRGIIRDITERKKAEQALRESQRWQRAILDSIPDIAWLKDTESRYIAVNEALCKAFGIKLEDFVGKTDFDISPEDLAKRYRADDQEVMKSGERKRVEELWGKKHGKGKRIWIETIKTPIYNDQGQVIGTSGIARDITARKKAEEALRESEEKYRKLFEETTDAIFVAEADTGIIIDCNRAASELVGREKSELIGKHQRILHPLQKIEGGFSKTFKQHVAEKKGQVLESQVITKKGEIKDVAIRASRFELKGEKRIQGLFRDITERKKAEEQIRKLSAAVEQSIDGIAIGDLEPRLLYVNEAFARMHGYTPEDMIGMPINKLHNKKQMAEYKKALNQLNKQGSWQGEIGHIRKDGTVFPVYTSVTLLRGDNDKPLGTLAINRDITESKRREQELDNFRKRITRAEQLATLGSLGAALAHELTQPLTVINLSIENALTELETTPYPGTVANKLRDVLTEVSRINSIAHRFRHATKRSSERIIRQVDLKAIAEKTLKLCDESARRAKVTLHLKDFDRLPSIYSNEEELEQVFFALVDNAIQAADGKKSRQLVISGVLKDKHIELRFSDNCGGIAPEHLDKIFEPFFTTKPAGQAMGLGLCIAEHIVSRAGGKVQVESKPGKGTTFYITLPINIHAK